MLSFDTIFAPWSTKEKIAYHPNTPELADAVCAESCDEAYLSIVSVTAKLTPMNARKPRVKRRKERVILFVRGTLLLKPEECAEDARGQTLILRKI